MATGENPNHLPLSWELDPQSKVTNLLDDYDDTIDAQYPGQDPDIAMAVASITPPNDVEMQDVCITPGQGFNPDLMRHGFDEHFARGAAEAGLGSTSPVTTRDDELLNNPVGRAPGKGRLGSSEKSGQKNTGQK